MGASGPKRGEDVTHYEAAQSWWLDVIEVIEEVALLETTSDQTLRILIELAVTSQDSNRPVFPEPLDEPILWRKFYAAVIDARDDAQAVKAEIDKIIPDMPKV